METETWTQAEIMVKAEAKGINVEMLEKRKSWNFFKLLLVIY